MQEFGFNIAGGLRNFTPCHQEVIKQRIILKKLGGSYHTGKKISFQLHKES